MDALQPLIKRLGSTYQRLTERLLLVPEVGLLPLALIALALTDTHPLSIAITALLAGWFCLRVGALLLARTMLDGGASETAGALLRFAQLLYPWSADTYALRGLLALQTDAPGVAEGLLRRASELAPGRAQDALAHSTALLQLGRAGEAVMVARRALSAPDTSPLAYLAVAEAERAAGAAPEVLEDLLRTGLRATRGADDEAALQCALANHLLTVGRTAEGMLAMRAAETLLPACHPLRRADVSGYLARLRKTTEPTERPKEAGLPKASAA